MSTVYRDQDLREAQVAFSLASQLIYREPDQRQIAAFIENHVFEEAPFGMENPFVISGLAALKAGCGEVEGQGLGKVVSDLKSEWFMLFIGAGTPRAPSWESFYREANSQLFGKHTLEVRRWYKDFGLKLENENREPDDNLGLMMGFMGYLMGLEIEALRVGETACAEKLKDAEEGFMVGHILPWLAVWHYHVRNHAHSDFYRGVGDLVLGLCAQFAERFDIEFNPVSEAFSFRTKKESSAGSLGGPEKRQQSRATETTP